MNSLRPSIPLTEDVLAIEGDAQPKLVVLLHDFEQFDPNVVQDLFYICRFVPPPRSCKARLRWSSSAFTSFSSPWFSFCRYALLARHHTCILPTPDRR